MLLRHVLSHLRNDERKKGRTCDQTADLIFEQLGYVERLLNKGRRSSAEEILEEAKPKEEKTDPPDVRVTEPGQAAAKRLGGVIVSPRTYGADPEKWRDRYASELRQTFCKIDSRKPVGRREFG